MSHPGRTKAERRVLDSIADLQTVIDEASEVAARMSARLVVSGDLMSMFAHGFFNKPICEAVEPAPIEDRTND